MSLSTEIETKLEIDECGFHRLRSYCTTLRCVEQLNVYYDSSWRLAGASATFRIRLSPMSEARMTLKVPGSWDEGRRSSRERETRLGSLLLHTRRSSLPRTIQLSELPLEFQFDLSAFGICDLRRVGYVRNTRYVLQLSEWTLELDRLRLPGGIEFFEVEIEHDDVSAHRVVVDRVRALVPHAQYSRVSKFERFRAAVDNLARRSSSNGMAEAQ